MTDSKGNILLEQENIEITEQICTGHAETSLAAKASKLYSKGRTAPKVEIDYIQKKQVKKPAGAKPGFVVYYTNYSLMAEPSLKGVREV